MAFVSFKRNPGPARIKGQAVVHTRTSDDTRPIDALEALLAMVTAKVAVKPAQPHSARVLWPIEAVEEVEEDGGMEWISLDADLDLELSCSELEELAVREAQLAEARQLEVLAQVGITRLDTRHKTFLANFKETQEWKAPGVRQDVPVKRFKRFGMKA